MIVFGTYITDERTFEGAAATWSRGLTSPDVTTAESRDEPTVAAGLNSILDAFAGDAALEAVVLVRQEVLLDDREVLEKVRKVLLDDGVAVAGLVGARNVKTLAWWEGEVVGHLPSPVQDVRHPVDDAQVELLDDSFLILSNWAVNNLRFDPAIGPSFDGISQDLCMQATAANKSVVVTEVDALTTDAKGYTTIESHRWADAEFQNKWGHRLIGPDLARPSTRLELGGGTNSAFTWLNVDPEHGVDDLCRGAQDVPWPVPGSHLRMIWASHVMEHIPAGGERIAVMNEAWRVLRPGGTFEVRVPMFPNWAAIADPTHVSYWVPQSFFYFTGDLGANADYGIQRWNAESIVVHDEWELRGVLQKPLDAPA